MTTVNIANNNLTPPAVAAKDNLLRQKASEFVNQIFYGTLMREFRNAESSGLFGGGPGGSTFKRQLDTEFIKCISQRGDAPLVDSVLNKIKGGATIKYKIDQALNAYKNNE